MFCWSFCWSAVCVCSLWRVENTKKKTKTKLREGRVAQELQGCSKEGWGQGGVRGQLGTHKFSASFLQHTSVWLGRGASQKAHKQLLSNYDLNTCFYFMHIFKRRDEDDLVLIRGGGEGVQCTIFVQFSVQFLKGFHMTCPVLNESLAFESAGWPLTVNYLIALLIRLERKEWPPWVLQASSLHPYFQDLRANTKIHSKEERKKFSFNVISKNLEKMKNPKPIVIQY